MENYEDEIYTGHGAHIPESASDKLYDSIVRIEIQGKKGINKGTGFFMKAKINSRQYKFLCTNYHLISQDYVDSKMQFKIYYGKKNNEIEKLIVLDNNKRFIKCYEKPRDACIIEIINNDNIPESKYLFPDLNYKNGFNVYINENFYLAGYPNDINFLGERHISSGKIKKIIDYEFTHSLDTRSGSSGSPICLINNQNIIGIHKSGNHSEHINRATFIGIILDDLERDENLLNRTQIFDLKNNKIGNRYNNKDKEKQLDVFKKGNNNMFTINFNNYSSNIYDFIIKRMKIGFAPITENFIMNYLLGYTFTNLHSSLFFQLESPQKNETGILIMFGKYFYKDDSRNYFLKNNKIYFPYGEKGGLLFGEIDEKKYNENYCNKGTIDLILYKDSIKMTLRQFIENIKKMNGPWDSLSYSLWNHNQHNFIIEALRLINPGVLKETFKANESYIPSNIKEVLKYHII